MGERFINNYDDFLVFTIPRKVIKKKNDYHTKEEIDGFRNDLKQFFKQEDIDRMEDEHVVFLLGQTRGRPRKYEYETLEERKKIYNNWTKLYLRQKLGCKPREKKKEGDERKEMIKEINRRYYLKNKLKKLENKE